MERLDLVMKEMEDWDFCNLPKAVREYLVELKEKRFTDDEADTLFVGYCDKIREANNCLLYTSFLIISDKERYSLTKSSNIS